MQAVESKLGPLDQAAEADILRAAAIDQQRIICVLDMDDPLPKCVLYPSLPQDNFRVLIGTQLDRSKAPVITDSASYSVVLGTDILPSQLLCPAAYDLRNVCLLSKLTAHSLLTARARITFRQALCQMRCVRSWAYNSRRYSMKQRQAEDTQGQVRNECIC